MVTIDEMTAEGDRVIVAWTFQGTQQGEFLGLAPTNKKITYVGVNGFRIGEGKLVEGWDLQDSLNLFQQLGLLPDTGTILTQASDKKD
jgi:predicted ester cyclase